MIFHRVKILDNKYADTNAHEFDKMALFDLSCTKQEGKARQMSTSESISSYGTCAELLPVIPMWMFRFEKKTVLKCKVLRSLKCRIA